MACQVFRDDSGEINRVVAPNGQESILFKDLLGDGADKEQALKNWIKAYTPSFKQKYGDWEKVSQMVSNDPAIDDITLQTVKDRLSVELDTNGEPTATFLKEKGLLDTPVQVLANLDPNGQLEDEVTREVVQQLQDKKLLGPRNNFGRYFILKEGNPFPSVYDLKEEIRQIEDLLEKNNIEYKRAGDEIRIYGLPVYNFSYNIPAAPSESPTTSKELMQEVGAVSTPVTIADLNTVIQNIKGYNEQNGTNYQVVANQNDDGTLQVEEIRENEAAMQSPAMVHQELIDRLTALFPQVSVQFIDQGELFEMSEGRFENNNTDVTAFVLNNRVYLVRNKITSDIVIEEFLHPFVSALVQENAELAANLYRELSTLYPDITEYVENTYTNFYGFTQADRENEVITKGLQRAFSQRIQNSYKAEDKATRNLLEQFLDFIRDVLRQITGRKKVYVGKLPTSMKAADIINLLDSNIRLQFGFLDKRARANLTDEKLSVLEYVTRNATAEQKHVVETLLSNEVVHNEVDHTYTKVIYDETGNIEDVIEYSSVTTAMKGTLPEDDKYAFNRDLGTEFDFIMNSLVMGEGFDTIAPQLRMIEEKAAKEFYDALQNYLNGLTTAGAIVVPQIVLTSDNDARAGKMDLLVIEPDGTMGIIDLKTSMTMDVNTKKYDTKYEVTAEDAVLYGERLSTRMQHGIQQHSYKRMLEIHPELAEYDVRYVKTIHFKSEVRDGKAVVVEFNGLVDHTLADYNEFVDKIVAEQPLARTTGTESTLSQEQAKPENRQTINDIRDLVKDALELLQNRRTFYETTNKTAKGKVVIAKEYMDELDEIISTLSESLVTGKPANAYYQLIKYINKDVKEKSREIGRADDKGEILQFLLETEKDMKLYREMLAVPRFYLKNKTITKLASEAQNYIHDTLDVIDVAIENYVIDFVANNTNRDLTREDVEKIVREAEDIGWASLQFGDLATSSDLMLSVFDKVYKRRLQEREDLVRALEYEIKIAGNKLATLSPDKAKMYDFMQEIDENGKPTGYYISKIGKQYWKMRRAIKDKLVDPETGIVLKYRDIKNLKNASKEDIEFNIELKKAKDEQNQFNQKEYLNDQGELVDGAYHKYTDEFKEARKKVMRLRIKRNSDGDAVSFEWVPKKPDSKEYKEFERKYYTAERTYLRPVSEYEKGQYVFKGRVEETSGRFVKPEFVEIREEAENGESMVNPRYKDLMNPTTDLGRAQKEYFETWTRLYEKLNNMLPGGSNMKNRLPVIRSTAMANMKKAGDGYFKGMMKSLSNLNPFTLNTYTEQVALDEDGNVVNSIPVFYTGDVKSEFKIKRLKEKILELQQRWAKQQPDENGKVLGAEEYKTKLSGLTKALRIENKKVGADEISTEMTSNLIQFANMAYNFHIMSEFESTVVAVMRTLRERRVTKLDGDGNIIKNSITKVAAKFKGKDPNGEDAYVVQRLQKWMDMVFYNTKNPYRSKMGEIVKKIKLFMSIKGVGLNPFGQVNNYVRGRIENNVEAAGGTLYSGKNYLRASKEFNTEFLPSFMSFKKILTFSKKSDANGDYYSLPRGYSKYDAIVKKYRMMRPMMSRDGIEGFESQAMEMLFMMQHGVEYSLQTKTGVAVTMTQTLTNKKTGEKVSVYDAHVYNEKTGEVTLDKELYEETDDMRFDLTNRIYEVNKRLHGNYAWEDRMVMQQTLMGEMAAQFHKWVYPYYRRVWGKPYHDENLGETEGILTSLFKLVGAFRTARQIETVNGKQVFTTAWDSLTDYQKSNIVRLNVNIGFFMLSLLFNHLIQLLHDDDDDDDIVKKKLINFFVYQSDRMMSELSLAVDPTQIGQFIKNPIALIGFTEDVWEAFRESFKFAIPPYGTESERFQRGVNKGELKFLKEWGDVLPVFNIANKWDSFEDLKSFYIK